MFFNKDYYNYCWPLLFPFIHKVKNCLSPSMTTQAREIQNKLVKTISPYSKGSGSHCRELLSQKLHSTLKRSQVHSEFNLIFLDIISVESISYTPGQEEKVTQK